MKSRIKIIWYSDGTKKYIPQSKELLFFWTNWYDERGGSPISFDTEEEAINCINELAKSEVLTTFSKG